MKVKEKIPKEPLGKRRVHREIVVSCVHFRWGLQDPGAAVRAGGRRPSLGISVVQHSMEQLSSMIFRETAGAHTLYLGRTRAISEPWRMGRISG